MASTLPGRATPCRQAPIRAWLGWAACLAVSLLSPLAHGALYELPGGAITINDNAPGTPFPSTVTATGVTGTVVSVRVKINGLTHTFPADIDAFLVSPSGAIATVFSDAGNNIPVSNVNLVFDDAAATFVPDIGAIVSGVYRPNPFHGALLPRCPFLHEQEVATAKRRRFATIRTGCIDANLCTAAVLDPHRPPVAGGRSRLHSTPHSAVSRP